MDPLLEKTFLQELDGQCNFALLALEDMKANEARFRGGDQMAGQRFWFSAQAMLAAFANISKILYPAKAACASRGNHLRTLLGGPVTAPFDHPSRKMRNHYEHFDERVDIDWWQEAGRKERADYCFFPVGQLEAQFGVKNCFRNFDSNTAKLTFMGDHFDLLPVANAVMQLKHTIVGLLAVR
jgi:hypothetical protein